MTNRELVDKYLAATGRRRSKDENGNNNTIIIAEYTIPDKSQDIDII